MKNVIFSVVAFVLLFFAASTPQAHAVTKIDPAQQIAWPASCTSGLVYSPSANVCVSPSNLSNGPIVYPAQCQNTGSIPSWCGAANQAPDVYIRAACAQLPSTGGTLNLLGLTGTIVASVPCSTPTKQVFTLVDNTNRLNISQNDGGITFPQDNGSALLGTGPGACIYSQGGLHLTSGANVTAIVGAVHTDGTQEEFAVIGVCINGATSGVTVTKGLVYANRIFTNTTIRDNNISVCNGSCAWVQDAGGTVDIGNNWFNVTDGAYTVLGSGLVIDSTLGTGCGTTAVNIWGGNAEHANGSGNSEIKIIGNGAGSQSCSVYVHDIYVERNIMGTPSVNSIAVQDCAQCSFTNIAGAGGTGASSGDLINISESAPGRVQNVLFYNVNNAFGSFLNTSDDTTALGKVIPFAQFPTVISYYSNPVGYIQPPVLPGTVLQSLGADALAGQGSFSTGSGTFGTNFSATGCISGTGVTCTFTRTSTSPPTGYTFSQEVQITANTDISSGFNGVQWGTSFSFISGQTYIGTFWGKGDGTFGGLPTLLLWNSLTPVYYCKVNSQNPSTFTTSWQLYTFSCTPNVSGSANLAITAQTPIGGTPGSTGSFYFAGFTFSQVQPLTPGSILGAATAYGVGSNPTVLYSAAGTPLPTCNVSIKGEQLTVSDASSPTYHGAYGSGGGAITSNVICSYNGSAYSWIYQ